jgi:hypothetical protein
VTPRTVLLAAVLALIASSAAGQQDGGSGAPSGTSLETIEERARERRARARELEERAATLSEQVRSLKAQSVTTARRIQELERELSDVEDTLATRRTSVGASAGNWTIGAGNSPKRSPPCNGSRSCRRKRSPSRRPRRWRSSARPACCRSRCRKSSGGRRP